MQFPVRRSSLFAALSFALCSAPLAVYAQASYPFNLPVQPLGDSLRAVGSQAGVDVAFQPVTVKDRMAPALKGSYSAQQALDRLLEGSGLSLRKTQGGTYLIVNGGGSDTPPPSSPKDTSSFTFNLPAQKLSTTLQTIAKDTGTQISVDSRLVASMTAVPVRGQMTTLHAVQQALVGTGLLVEVSSTGDMVIRRADQASTDSASQTLDTVVVTAKVQGLAAMRVPTELREVPQSVSVISQETLQQQNAVGLADAFNWATGITVQRSSSTESQFYARGFEISQYHVDGGAPIGIISGGSGGASPTDDLSEYDHIEVLRGADGLFGGSGNPGATVSLQRKQPQATPAASATLSIGSWDYRRLMVDATGPLAFDGALRGRMVATYTDQDYFYDAAQRKQHKFYGILEYDLTSSTLVTVGGSVEQVDAVPFIDGLPRYDDGTDPHLPRSTSLVFPWNRSKTHNNEVFARVEQQFNDDWKLKVGANLLQQNYHSAYGQIGAAISPATNLYEAPPTAIATTGSGQTFTADATLTGVFHWGGQRQEVILGMDMSRLNSPGPTQQNFVLGPPVNLWSFDPNAYTVAPASPFTPVITEKLDLYAKQVGGYAALRMYFGDDWSVIVGARDNYQRSESGLAATYDLGPDFGSMQVIDNKTGFVSAGVVTPYAGLVYNINKQYSLYASYADIYTANAGTVGVSGNVLPPTRGVNLEAGIKASWNEGRLNGSFALFKIDQTGVPYNDPNNPPHGNCCWLNTTNTSKGFETEFSGEVATGWQLGAGYTFNLSRQLAGTTSQSALSTITPKHMLKLWTNYQLPGTWQRWSVGGGLRAQSGNYISDYGCTEFNSSGYCVGAPQPYRITQGFYTVVTARAAYQFDAHWSAALNIDNLFDRRYYDTLGGTFIGNWYGVPRSFMLTIRGQL